MTRRRPRLLTVHQGAATSPLRQAAAVFLLAAARVMDALALILRAVAARLDGSRCVLVDPGMVVGEVALPPAPPPPRPSVLPPAPPPRPSRALPPPQAPAPAPPAIDTGPIEAGLVALGCKPKQAREAVARAMRKGPQDVPSAMRAALQELTAGR